MDYFMEAMGKYADFSGRAARKNYWMFILFYMIFYLVLVGVDVALGLGILSLVFSLAMLVPSLSCGARRLHATGRSGWWLLISLIPIIGVIVLIVFLAQNSEADNAYGPSPSPA